MSNQPPHFHNSLSKENHPPSYGYDMNAMTSIHTHLFGAMQASLCVNYFCMECAGHQQHPWPLSWFLDDHHDTKISRSKAYVTWSSPYAIFGLFPKTIAKLHHLTPNHRIYLPTSKPILWQVSGIYLRRKIHWGISPNTLWAGFKILKISLLTMVCLA